MGDVVNLRRARKAATRRERDAEAERNRVAYGLPKSLKASVRKAKERAEASLAGHRLDRAPDTRQDAD